MRMQEVTHTAFEIHPILGTSIALLFGIIGSFLPIIEIQIPIIYMQFAQLLFWTLGGIVSILTIRSIIVKEQKDKKDKQKK
jgi:hypothetical protein